MIKYIKYLKKLFIFLAIIVSYSSIAQMDRLVTCKGQVTNKEGEALSQVNIKSKTGRMSAVSGRSGEFEINCLVNDTLIFTKQNFVLQKIVAREDAFMHVEMMREDNEHFFDQIVNIPFATRSKQQLNYATSSLDANKLPSSGITNTSSILAGRLSGLLMMQTGNQPGGDNVSFQIRGKSSFARGSDPVVLVDGIERSFSEMDPNEIESVTVLKDAAALNWYGLYGGNGVVLVTTKHGKANNYYIDFTGQTGFEKTGKLMKPLNSYDFARLYNQGLSNNNQQPAFSQQDLDAYKNHTDPYLYPDNNYIQRFLGDKAPLQRYALSMGGGGEKVRYFTTLAFMDQNGLFKETKTKDYNSNFNYKRFNFRINLDYDVTKTLSFTVLAGLRSVLTNDVGNGTASVLNTLFTLRPNAFPILNKDSSYGGTSIYQTNPLGQLQNTGVSKVTNNALTASLSAKQKLDIIANGLSANVFFAYDGYGDYAHGFAKNYAVTDFTVTPSQTYRTPALLTYSSASFGTNTKNTELWLGLDYDHIFKTNHQINASVRAQQYVSAAVDRIDYRERMLVARADYNFESRYFLGFTGSYSGSEDYAPGRRFGFFPAVSAGWVVTNEKFIKNFQELSYLKLRASYGRSGNVGPTYDANGNVVRLPYRSLFTRGAGPILGSSFSGTTTAYEVSPSGNPLTTWEKIDRLNIGTDLGFFKNDLSFSVDYFNETRNDILSSSNLPSILGITVSAINSGKVNSKGVDMSAAYNKIITDKLHIQLNANLTYASNKLLEQSLPSGTLNYQSPIGHNIGNVSASGTKLFYISEGLFQNQDEINASPQQTLAGLVVPGDIKYKDINGDGIIDSRDRVYSDYSNIPKGYYGFGFDISYGPFDFTTQFEGIWGRTIDIKSIVNAGPNSLNQLSLQSWTQETAATAIYPRIAITDNGNNNANSDYWLRSGNFLKLRSAEIGFSLPQTLCAKLKMQKARFFIGGYNLFTIAKNKELAIDPETPEAGRGSNYPYLQTYTFGINVKF